MNACDKMTCGKVYVSTFTIYLKDSFFFISFYLGHTLLQKRNEEEEEANNVACKYFVIDKDKQTVEKKSEV